MPEFLSSFSVGISKAKKIDGSHHHLMDASELAKNKSGSKQPHSKENVPHSLFVPSAFFYSRSQVTLGNALFGGELSSPSTGPLPGTTW
jgi:hypothetical protein